MNALTRDAIANIIGSYAPMMGAYYKTPRARPSIKPMQMFPIYADTLVLTWDDLAVCRL